MTSSAPDSSEHDDDDDDDSLAPVSVARAKEIEEQRARDLRSQYARDIQEAGKAHGLDIRLVDRPEAGGETVLVAGYPEKVPFGMLLTLGALREQAGRSLGRIDVAHAILEDLRELEETGDGNGIDEDSADAFRERADLILNEEGAPRIEVDVFR